MDLMAPRYYPVAPGSNPNGAFTKHLHSWAVVVAQLVEWSLPILKEVQTQSSAKIYIFIEHLITVNCVLKRRK